VALAPLDFGRFSHDLLIGQFAGGGDTQSSGFIAAYDLATGKFDGLLQDSSGKPLAINGVWALSPGNVSPTNSDAAGAPATEMYFTAGRAAWLFDACFFGVDRRKFPVIVLVDHDVVGVECVTLRQSRAFKKKCNFNH
jgi:hypothetical protein